MDSLVHWLALAHLPGLGRRARVALLEHFREPEAIFDASRSALKQAFTEFPEEIPLEPTTALEAISREPSPDAFNADLDWLAKENRYLVTWNDNDYPPLLRLIADPPLVLYVHGIRASLTFPQLAIVGSRNPTPIGRQNAHAFGATLAEAGLSITSGLALGIDAAAHRGALDAGGTTVALAGTGLDRVYPARNRELAHDIVARGAMVSEFSIGTPPLAGHFPQRNRLISGMSLGVLVVEAALQSGSLITARFAGEQGREVYALPGSIHSPLSRGCHSLIRQGAKLVETARDVLEGLGPLVRATIPNVSESAPSPTLSSTESRVLDHVGHEPSPIDVVIARCGLTADTVSSILLQLELRGLVLVGPYGYQRAP